MINEIALQLRGEAGARQVKNAEFGLVENGAELYPLKNSAAG